ncbi:MAG TPA: AAA family ATPase, partial [Syntrophorhabdaceae bacterium]|nr:AAA family ATPase [Syntrophorhabdaceae bacterium]
MYRTFYGLRFKPFQILPNPDFFYMSPKHENAMTYLEYGIMERSGFVLLTGEIGAGKSILIKYILGRLETTVMPAVVTNTNVTPDELLSMVLASFDIQSDSSSKTDKLGALRRFLTGKSTRGRQALLIIDEAQNLSREALEEVRMLSNLVDADQMLLQIILVGQPEIRERLTRPELAQLNQRITVAYHLGALTEDETRQYIVFRLEKAGGRPDLFTHEAMRMIFTASGGIPRTINILCDSALVYGFADETKKIGQDLVEQVIRDRGGMGLTVNREGGEGRDNEMAAFPGCQELTGRVSAVEMGLADMKVKMQWLVGNLERTSQGFKDDLVLKMKELYTEERKRSDKLLFEFSRLKDRYTSLVSSREQREAEQKKIQYLAEDLENQLRLERERYSSLL